MKTQGFLLRRIMQSTDLPMFSLMPWRYIYQIEASQTEFSSLYGSQTSWGPWKCSRVRWHGWHSHANLNATAWPVHCDKRRPALKQNSSEFQRCPHLFRLLDRWHQVKYQGSPMASLFQAQQMWENHGKPAIFSGNSKGGLLETVHWGANARYVNRPGRSVEAFFTICWTWSAQICQKDSKRIVVLIYGCSFYCFNSKWSTRVLGEFWDILRHWLSQETLWSKAFVVHRKEKRKHICGKVLSWPWVSLTIRFDTPITWPRAHELMGQNKSFVVRLKIVATLQSPLVALPPNWDLHGFVHKRIIPWQRSMQNFGASYWIHLGIRRPYDMRFWISTPI